MNSDERRYTRLALPMTMKHGRRVARAVHETTRDPSDPQGAWRASVLALDYRRQLVDDYVRDCCGLTVRAGPFAGMKYVEGAAGSLYSPKILGSYEQELHPYIRALPGYRRLVNVGCGEGYYAVGAKVMVPGIEVLAFDIDPDAIAKCRALAAANGVERGLHLEAQCTPDRLAGLAAPGTLVLLDVEGAEVDLLGGLPPERAAQCDFLVETHTVAAGVSLGAVVAALAGTHDITVVDQQPRDWKPYPELYPLGQIDRFLAQWEGRGPEPWVFAGARTGKA